MAAASASAVVVDVLVDTDVDVVDGGLVDGGSSDEHAVTAATAKAAAPTIVRR
jgi:hypothetical protein